MEKLVLKSRRIITKSYGRAMVVACSLALAFTFSVPRAFAQEETELARANRANQTNALRIGIDNRLDSIEGV